MSLLAGLNFNPAQIAQNVLGNTNGGPLGMVAQVLRNPSIEGLANLGRSGMFGDMGKIAAGVFDAISGRGAERGAIDQMLRTVGLDPQSKLFGVAGDVIEGAANGTLDARTAIDALTGLGLVNEQLAGLLRAVASGGTAAFVQALAGGLLGGAPGGAPGAAPTPSAGAGVRL